MWNVLIMRRTAHVLELEYLGARITEVFLAFYGGETPKLLGESGRTQKVSESLMGSLPSFPDCCVQE